jgi:hypothetical protein
MDSSRRFSTYRELQQYRQLLPGANTRSTSGYTAGLRPGNRSRQTGPAVEYRSACPRTGRAPDFERGPDLGLTFDSRFAEIEELRIVA